MCRSTRMNASWRGRGFSNRAYFDDERVNGLWRRRVTDKTTAADRSIVKINTLFGHCSTPPRSIICSVVRVTGDHTGPRYAATFPQHARLCWPIAGLDDKASLEYFSRPRLASKILPAMRARRFVHRWIHRRWRDGVGSDGIGTRRARREQSGRAIRTDERDGANRCKRSKYDPRPRRKTFGIVVKLFQPMVKGRDVTLFPRLEVEQSGRSVKSMAVVSRSSITRAARASIYRRWGRFFREVDSR